MTFILKKKSLDPTQNYKLYNLSKEKLNCNINVAEVYNVKSYTNDTHRHQSWVIEQNQSLNPLSYYFCCETDQNEAFGHFVFETCIYIPLFKEMVKEIPELKFHCNVKKDYKTLFFKYFGIEDKVVYELNDGNVCYFPEPISFMNENDNLNFEDMNNNIEIINFFKSYLYYDLKKVNNVLLMPRQSKENFKPNDRIIPMNGLIEIFQNKKLSILNTDGVSDLFYQILTVSYSKTIILTDGSPVLVNGFFTQGSDIICIGTTNVSQIQTRMKYKVLFDYLKKFNNYRFIPIENIQEVEKLFE